MKKTIKICGSVVGIITAVIGVIIVVIHHKRNSVELGL